jgi:hypothetical protein
MTAYWVQLDYTIAALFEPLGSIPPPPGPPVIFQGESLADRFKQGQFGLTGPFAFGFEPTDALGFYSSFVLPGSFAQGQWLPAASPLPPTFKFTGCDYFIQTMSIGASYAVGTQPDPTQIAGPILGVSAADEFNMENVTRQWNSYIWTKIQTSPDLFTSGADQVNFNNLTSLQQAAITDGADIYDGLGGDDVVTLPNVANYNESVGGGHTLGWDPSQTFSTGSQAGDIYTVNGGDGSYALAAGSGQDTFTISGTGQSTLDDSAGGTAIVSGTFGGSATIGGTSTLELLPGADITGSITFAPGSTGTLKIDATAMPSATIKGLVPGDTIDLKNVPLNSFGYTLLETTATSQGYNILQVVDGGNYYLNLELPQNFTGGFALSPDAGGTGTDIMVTPSFVAGSALIGTPTPATPPFNTPPLTGYSTYPQQGATPNPYGAVIQIITTQNGVLKGEATGSIINANSTGGGTILTAAHVLEDLQPGQQISIYAANATYGNGGQPIFANIPAADLRPNPAYSGSPIFPDPQNDFGVIAVPQTISLSAFGVLPIDTTFSSGTVNITGYPGFTGQTTTQFNQIGSVTESSAFDGTFEESTPFSVNGDSGGPLWLQRGDSCCGRHRVRRSVRFAPHTRE